jgi:hypothetical protein
MKKLVLLFCLFSLSFAAIRLQGQADILGYGVGLGLGTQVIPLLLEVGVEGSTHSLPPINVKGTHQSVDYDGDVNIAVNRVGGYAKFTIPGLNLIPIVGAFANPTLHFGTQSGTIGVDGNVRLGTGVPFDDNRKIDGAYALLGFPSYLAWFFIEPAIGTQHIYVPGVTSTSFYDVQLAIGASF